MLRKKVSKLCIPILAVGIMSTSVLPASAATISTKSVAQVEQEYGLKPIDKAPAGAKILKFDTPEQAEAFMKVMKQNEKNGVLDLSSVSSNSEIQGGTIDLSNKQISSDNFKKVETTAAVDKSNVPVKKGISAETYNTTLRQSITVGVGQINIHVGVKVDWDDDKGNYISQVRSVTSTFTGTTLGSAWTQTSYDDNISDNGQSVDVTVYGKYDYYILINTSMTSWAGGSYWYTRTFSL